MQQSPSHRPLDDVASAAFASGAHTWWAAGHAGGSGGSDVPAILSVVQDPVYRGHPAFAGMTFEGVPGEPVLPPSYTGNGHGTAIVSMAAAQGPTGCTLCEADDARQKGTAHGVSKVLDPDGAYSEFDWPLGVAYGRFDSATRVWRYQPGARDPAQVLNYSRGGDVAFDDDIESQGWDMMVDSHGATAAVAAGNSGPAPRTINNPALAYNVIGVGAYCCSTSSDHTEDEVWGWSSRGPTISGRKKPDLVAPGNGFLADVLYQQTGTLWKNQTGTSFAAPQVAAAAILLAGAGIRDPKVVKAILINSARAGRAAPDAPWGSQTGWQPDFGWGELDLDTAYRERLNFVRGSVPPHGARFFRATTTTAGDRATLVWHRRVTDCAKPREGCLYEPSSGRRVFTLSNLDLTAYAAPTGAQLAASTSAIDNVEQVRTAQTGETIYKVTAGGVDTIAGEPFALAGTRELTALTTPQPAVALTTTATGSVGPNHEVTVTAAVANPSPDLAAPDAHVTLNLPAGTEIVDGSQTQALGTLAKHGTAGAESTATWTIRGTTGGTKRLTATASAAVYGSTLTGSGSATLAVDAAAPRVTVAAPASPSKSDRLAISWAATDPAGIASHDVEVAVNGAPWAPWHTATAATAATYVGTAGSSYRFRARARDLFGNQSAFVTSAPIAIARPTATPPTAQPPKPRPRRSPALSLIWAVRTGRALHVHGSVRRGATGRVAATWSARRAKHRFSARKSARIRGGEFGTALRIPRRARRVRHATLTLSYPGDSRFAPARRRFAVRSR